MKEYKRLSIEFPAEEYVYLKMACAKQGVTIKNFVTSAITLYIEEYENQLAVKALEEALAEEKLENAVPLDQLKSELGYESP